MWSFIVAWREKVAKKGQYYTSIPTKFRQDSCYPTLLHFQMCNKSNISYAVLMCLKSQQTDQNSLSTTLSAPYSHEIEKLNIVTVRCVLLWYESLSHMLLKSWNFVKHNEINMFMHVSKETKSFQKEKKWHFLCKYLCLYWRTGKILLIRVYIHVIALVKIEKKYPVDN